MNSALLQASLAGAVMILAAAILRIRFGPKTPRRVFCLLWDIVLLRLLVLIQIPSPFSIKRLLALRQSAPPSVQTAVFQGGMEIGDAVIQMAPSTAHAQSPDLLCLLWCAGAAVCAVWLLWGHLQSRSLYAMSLPVEDGFIRSWQAAHPLRRFVQVRRSDRIAAPLTYGILQPVVLLPSRMDLSDREDLSYILEHEYTHIRRCDTLRKTLLAAGLCLHWFNPFVWLFWYLANRDIELACDEAVVRSGADREGYALALLRMEEKRGSTVLSGSHFSGHALEERIEAIMKHKHVSLTALLAVLVVMAVTTTVFATSAPEKKMDLGLVDGRQVQTVVQDGITISRGGEDGETYYSDDGGETWMNEERWHAQYGGDWGDRWQVEWWTYDEYKAWLEQEKRDLADIIGERGYTSSKGWFVWDQKMVDETIAMYEKTLDDIKNGVLYSKSIMDSSGSAVEDTMLSAGTGCIMYAFDDSTQTAVDTSSLLDSYRAFGVTGNEKDGLYYNGQPIRYLVDGFSADSNGYCIRYTYCNDQGSIDIHTLWEAVPLPGGGYDPSGKLLGFAQKGDEGFDAGMFSVLTAQNSAPETAFAVSEKSDKGRTFAEIFAEYAAYGVRYDETAQNEQMLTYNGAPVAHFADLKPDGSVFSYNTPYCSDGLFVLTIYQDGQLTGLNVK